MRLLGVDYGEVRVGLALGDTETRIASAWKTVERTDDISLIKVLQACMCEESLERIVIGIPRPLSDQTRETDQAKTIRRFIGMLQEAGCLVDEEDETWSSALAARQSREAGKKGKRDDFAAAIILQSYLDRYGVSS